MGINIAKANKLARKRHLEICIKSNCDYHSYKECLWFPHQCLRCNKLVIGSNCPRCQKKDNDIARSRNNRWDKFSHNFEGQSLEGEIKIKHKIEMKAGGFDQVKELIQGLSSSLSTSIPVLKEKLKGAAIDQVFGSSMDFVKLLVKTITSILLICRVSDDKVALGLVLAQTFALFNCDNALGEWMSSLWIDSMTPLVRLVVDQTIEKGSSEIGDDLEGQSATTHPGLLNLTSVVLAFVHCIVFGVKPNLSSLGHFVQNMCKIGMATTGVANLVEACTDVGRILTDWIAVHVFGCTRAQVEEELDPFLAWSEDVDALYRSEDRKNVTWTHATLKKFDVVYDRGVQMRRDTVWLNKDRSLSLTFNTRMAMMTKMLDEINASGARQQSRIEPFMFYMFGESGIGKSLLLPIVALNYLARFQSDELELHNFDHVACTYTRKSGDPRWDGVGDQIVYIYDDYGQAKDSLSNPNTELFETIELGNTTPFNPLMAECSKKGRVQLAPHFIIHTSNVMCPEVVSLVKPVAVARRFDMIVEAIPRDQVCHDGALDMDLLRQFHATKECGCDSSCDVCLNAIFFQRWEVVQYMNGNTMAYVHEKVGELMSFSELMTNMLNECSIKRVSREGRKEFFKDLASKLVNKFKGQSGDEDDITSCSHQSTSQLTDNEMAVEEELRILDEFIFESEKQKMVEKADSRAAKVSTALQEAATIFKDKVMNVLKTIPLARCFAIGFTLVAGMICLVKGKSILKHTKKIVSGLKPSTLLRRTHSFDALHMTDRSELNNEGGSDESVKRIERMRANKRSIYSEEGHISTDENKPSSDIVTIGGKIKTFLDDKLGDLRHLTQPERFKKMNLPYDETVDIVGQGMTDPNLDMVMRKVYRQTYDIESMNGVRMGSGVVVKGSVFLTFGHCIPKLQTKFFLVNVQTKIKYICHSIDKNYKKVGDDTDIIMFTLPRIVPQGADIVGLFVEDCDVIQDEMFHGRLFTTAGWASRIHYGTILARDETVKYEVKEGDIVIRHHYEYRFDTDKGYCGSLLFRMNKTKSTKIIGMHVAGAQGESFGIASALCVEHIRGALTEFGLQAQCSFPIDDYNLVMEEANENLITLGALGRSSYGISDPLASSITPSPMHHWDGPPIKRPVFLRGLVNGKHVKETARLKLSHDVCETLDKDYLRLASMSLLHEVRKASPESTKEIWSLNEAAFGNPVKKYCESLDMTTSSGMPWKKLSKRPGKKGFLNINTHFIRQDLADAVEERIRKASICERSLTLWSDHYKDELRLVEGSKYEKPRLISGAPLDYTLAIRRYFGAFVSCVMQGRITNGVAVGINPHGDEWSLLARTLLSKSSEIFCGDFSCYDGTLHVEIMQSVCDIVNAWYDDDNDVIRNTLFCEILNAAHVSMNQIYLLDHGCPSGSALTSILNSLYQLVANYYIMLKMGKRLPEIKRKFFCVTYGDDNINAVSTGSEFLDLTEYADAYKKYLGMKLTCSNKVGLPHYVGIQDADFLSRGFRAENGVYYGPRDWDSLSLVFNWIKSNEPWESLIMAYTECAYHELSHYSEDEFDLYSKKIEKYCNDRGWVASPLFNVNYYRDNLRNWYGSDNFLFCWGM